MSNRKRTYEHKARAESQQATRERIAAAAASLHEEVGIAKTTVSDIARRAGVQRLTVYNHFPDLTALAAGVHRPLPGRAPDAGLRAAIAVPNAERLLRASFARLYGWYRADAPMQARVRGERRLCPSSTLWRPTSRSAAGGLADGLAVGLDDPQARPLVALALDFWTWERLDREGLDDAAAADLMACVAAPPR